MRKLFVVLALVAVFSFLFSRAEKRQDFKGLNLVLVSKLCESEVAVEVFSLDEEQVVHT